LALKTNTEFFLMMSKEAFSKHKSILPEDFKEGFLKHKIFE